MVGYNDKMRILLEAIVGRIEQFEVKPDRFFVMKVSFNASKILFWLFLSLQISDLNHDIVF